MERISFLTELVKVDSSDKNNANKLVDLCSQYLSDNGIDGEILENNGYKMYVATIGSGEKTVVLNGHLDVVSGRKEQFTSYLNGDKLYGRGTADMKGGCVGIINAFIALSKLELDAKVMLQLVSDEEIGGENCSKYLVEKGYIGDFVICAEPTNLNPCIQSKGIIRIDVVSNGMSAHGSRPWEGKNAILKALNNFNAIESLDIISKSSSYYESSSVNLAVINGGDIYNRVPDRCVMGLDIRYIPELDPTEILDKITEAIDGDVIVKVIEPGVYVTEDQYYVRKLVECIKESIPDEEVIIRGQHGGSDARFFAQLGIPAIEFGPSGDGWHGDDEYVVMNSIEKFEDIVIDFIKSF